jgi:hypothetical protein
MPKECKHEESYPAFVFHMEATTDVYLYVVCDGCGLDMVQKGELVNYREDE